MAPDFLFTVHVYMIYLKEITGQMKTRGKWLWRQEWYSICSAHYDDKDGCPYCEAGRWVNVWVHNIEIFVYKRWPDLWRWWANRK